MNVCCTWVFGFIFTWSSGLAHAQSVHGVFRVVKGDVQIKSSKLGKNLKARVGEKVYPKDVILTAKDARAKIVMVDNNEINISPDSQIEIKHYEFDPNAGKKDVLLNVIYGKVRSKVEQKYDGKTSKFQVKTPSAVAGVRGTDFLTGFINGTTNIVTFEGTVEFGLPGPGGIISNPVLVTRGTTAGNTSGANPTPPAPIPNDQLVKLDADTKVGGLDSSPRSPANTPAPKVDPEGKCTMCGPAGGPSPELLPPPLQPPPVVVPTVPIASPILQPCDACRVGTEQGNSQLIIHVTN